jgi:quinoprotein glucose dehydrogenase
MPRDMKEFTMQWRRALSCVAALAIAALGLLVSAQSASDSSGEWRAYGGTNANLKYAPLDQINKENVSHLRIAWRQSAMPEEVRSGRGAVAVPTNHQVTPLMIGGLLYASAGDGSVVALHPATGVVQWAYVPDEFKQEATAKKQEADGATLGGRSANRGVAYWGDGDDARVIAIAGRSLVALNARTGALVASFGRAGRVDLTQGYRRPAVSFRWTSVPTIVKDVIVVGGMATSADGQYLPGDIRAYDVRTGQLAWTFAVVPQPGEFGSDTWQKDSYAYSGAAGVWGLLGADDELGYLYVATETPSSLGGDFWGGRRHGNNLFAESLVCLDARTGKRVWHFQAVHHGIWDYDFNAPPILIDITVDGRRIKAIAEVSKQAFVYVLDRATGTPVWPIEERPVPKGAVPGEWYSPTQPFPTKPPAYDQQGVTVDDLIDFTPELRQEALAILKQYHYGPLFTPPTSAGGPSKTKGTVQMPGAAGGSNWTGAAADPETGVLYVTSVHTPFIAEMISAKDPEAARGNAPTGASAALVEWATRRGLAVTGPWLEGPRGLPIFKPPYGRLVAIDLNHGEIRWTTANGNGPRDHPAIKHLNLPPLGQGGRVSPLVTKTMVFLGEGGNNAVVALPPWGGGKMFRAFDKVTGQVIWETELPAGTTGAPMTYMFDGKQFIVVATGWKDTGGELVALALP